MKPSDKRNRNTPRGTVLSIRLDDLSLQAVDLLVEAGLAQSRSEAASRLVAAGVSASGDLLARARQLADNVRQLRADMVDAVKARDACRVKALLERDATLAGARNDTGEAAVLLAAYYHSGEIKQLLLERGPELDLYEAAAVASTPRIAQLLGARPLPALDEPNADGYTPLGLAAYFGGTEAAALLLAAGADPNKRSCDGKLDNTPLHAAVAGGHADIVRLLLERGADPDAQAAGSMRAGFTPLHVAVHFDRSDIAGLLLDGGARLDLANGTGQTPHDYALAKERQTIAALLRQKGGSAG